jgi:hypothetical protein
MMIIVEIFGLQACFFIRSGVYKELCGFDETFAHQEEIDLVAPPIKGYKIKYHN